MYKLDFKGTVKDVEGNEFDIASSLAIILQHSRVGDSIKFNSWAIKLVVDGRLTIDKADIGTLKSFIEETDTVINLMKANILERIENKQEVKDV